MAEDQPLGEELELCRLCLAHEDLVWIFDERMKDDVREIIRTTSGVEILPSDTVTQKVCVGCLQITIKMFKFRMNAIKNDRDLKAKYGQLERTNKAATSVARPSSSRPTNKKQKTTADIDSLPQELSNRQPQNVIANVKALPPQPQLRRVHPSVMKIMRENPGYKLPKMPKNEHYLPVITLLRDEVVNWFKSRNYSDSDIERQRRMALACLPTSVTTDRQQVSAAMATTRRRSSSHRTSEEHQNDKREIRLSSNIVVRPTNSDDNVRAQIRCAPLEKLIDKPTSDSDKSEDIGAIISELLSKTKQSPSKFSKPCPLSKKPCTSKSSRACPLSKKPICDIQSTSANGSGNYLFSMKVVDNGDDKKDSALISASKQCRIRVGDEASSSRSEIAAERDINRTPTVGSSRKRKSSVDSGDHLGNNDSASGVVMATQQARLRSTAENIGDVFAVKKSRSPVTVAKQPEPQQQQRLDRKEFLVLKCTECPATYDRLAEFNVHVRFHADRKALRQYRHNGAQPHKNSSPDNSSASVDCKTTVDEKSLVAPPSPSPTPSTNSNSSEALSYLDNNAEDASTSAFLIPKSTGSKLFPCKICDSLHCTERDLKMHVRKRHTKCQFCAARFKTPEERDEHIDLSCGVTRVLKNLKPAEIKLVKVDRDTEVKRKYPEAFGLMPHNEACGSREPASGSTRNYNCRDLWVREDTSVGSTPASLDDDVIPVSDDETCEAVTVVEPDLAPKPGNSANSFRPTITIVDNSILQGVDICDDDTSMMKFLLTKMVLSQDETLTKPTDEDILTQGTPVFKNLRKQLYKHTVAVEIQHADKLSVTYNHEITPAKPACDNNWNLLPPKQLMTYKEILERQKLINARAAHSTSTSSVANNRNTFVKTQVGKVESR